MLRLIGMAVVVFALIIGAQLFFQKQSASFLTAAERASLRDVPLDLPPSPNVKIEWSSRPESRQVAAPKGAFELAIEPSGRAARQAVHEERSRRFHKGEPLEQTQSRNAHRDPLATELIDVTKDGQLVGAFKTTGNQQQPYQLWAYDLNPRGLTKRVVVSGGKIDGETVVLVRATGFKDELRGLIILAADRTISVDAD